MEDYTPFFNRAARLAKLRTRFFVPGHKGNPSALPAPFATLLPYDLTEIEGADDLSQPTGVLAQSQANMARAYGSGATLYAAGGTTSCILAMLHLFLRPGQPVLMARGCHVAALRALVLTGAVPVWLPLDEGRLRPPALAAALQKHTGAPVYLTSPDYYGRMAPLAALATLCEEAGSALLVDNAHGAHLRFLEGGRHPLQQGAAATADSAHKTLPCLTGAALLHLQDPALAAMARECLNLYSSTSPSYLVLESLDLCAGLLLRAPPNFTGAAQQLAGVAKAAAHLVLPGDDPLKLCLCPALAGYGGKALLAALRAAGILPEYFDGERIVLMAGPYNSEEDFALLAEVLEKFPPKEARPFAEAPLPLPKADCTPREAFFAPRESLPLSQALGRVAAGLNTPCPPGVPLLAPGEVIGKAEAEGLRAGGIFTVDVVK